MLRFWGIKMKMLIIGLGNIGAIHGWALSQAVADITHVVRKGTKSKFENGIKGENLQWRLVSMVTG
jgi:ketopantoate reductase